MFFIVPIFVKQNTGLAFVAGAKWITVIFIAHAIWRKQRVAGYVWLLAGLTAGFSAALLAIHFIGGPEKLLALDHPICRIEKIARPRGNVHSLRKSSTALVDCSVCRGAWLLWYRQSSHQANSFPGSPSRS